MDQVLQGLRWSCCLVYLDDIISFGTTFEDALDNLTLIFERLRTYVLQLKSTKCHLFQTSVPFLGHVVGRRGLECDPKKIEDVKSWPVPDCLKSPASETGSTDDGLLDSSKNKHNPVMVYNDLMIRNNTVCDYNKNRSQPVTIQCPITWVGAPVGRRRQTRMICPNRALISDYCSFLPNGFSATICGTSISIRYIYCLITLVT